MGCLVIPLGALCLVWLRRGDVAPVLYPDRDGGGCGGLYSEGRCVTGCCGPVCGANLVGATIVAAVLFGDEVRVSSARAASSAACSSPQRLKGTRPSSWPAKSAVSALACMMVSRAPK